MYCKYCGNSIEDNSKFCPTCGANIEAEQMGNTSSEASPYYSAPNQSQYANYTPSYVNNPNAGEGFAIAGFICSLVSVFLCCCGGLISILGIVFSSIAKSRGYKGGLATAGLVLGIIGLIFSIIIMYAAMLAS